MTQPFLYPGAYSPGQFAFNNNPELSQLITMFGGPLMGALAGPGNFMPHMMPGQAIMDQFTMRNYQMQTRQATMGVANYQNDEMATRLLGLRSAFTNTKPTDMNREQAMQMANVLNNPMVKTVMGMAMGPENVEALLHGARGDVQSLGSTINRIGYFRRDPGGGGRMDGESLEDLTTGVFSHLYEPQGDVGRLGKDARRGGRTGATAISRLQEAADMRDKTIVSDAEVETRLKGLEAGRVDELYKKYVQGGTATDAATQAKELTRFDRAINEAKVLNEDEASIGQLETRAKRRPTDEMHGFMAGQIGQMTENLFQRGMLPPSIGALDAASRVSAISETKLDDATIERLARKQAERDIMGKNDDYSARFSRMSDSEKTEEIDKVVGSYVSKIKDTKTEADKTARGERGAKSAEDVLQMVGGEALAGNVDASRTAGQIKQYTESVKAVRDIFGDNGNPNAPMPALMAVLDQLTHGAMGSMKPAAVASTLRQMQTLARETGTGMQQLGAISAHAGSLGQQLGIAPSITMQNVANTLGMTKAAMDSGAFSNPVFGARSKEEFQVRSTEMLQRGEASGNAKAMAALNRIYQMDRAKFDADGGTELAAAMAAYNDPNSDGTYTFNDPKTGEKVTRNLYRDVGQGRGQAARALLQRSGGNDADFMAAVYDERTGEFQRAGKGFLTQKHERINYLSQMIGEGTVSGRLRDKNSRQFTGALEGLNDPRVGAQLQRSLSNTLTGMVFESSHMNLEDQATYLQKHMKPKLVEHFKAQGHPDPEKAAEQVYQQFGADRGKLDRFIGNVGQAYQHAYGENMAAGAQMYSQGRDVSGVLEAGKALSRTDSAKRLLGYESSVGARVSDYLLDIGERGQKFSASDLAAYMMRTGSNEEFARTYAGEMGAGMDVLGRRRKAVSKSADDIKAVSTRAKAGGRGGAAAMTELRKLAGVEDDTLVISQQEVDAAREAQFADESAGGMSTEALREAWAKSHPDSTGRHLTREQLISDLRTDTQFNTQHAADYRSRRGAEAGKTKVVTQDELEAMAIRRNVGRALDGKEGEHEDIRAVQRAIDKGDDSSALASGLSASTRVFATALRESGAKPEELKKLVESTGDAAQGDILKAFGLTKEQYDAALKQEDPSKTKEGRAAEAASAYIAMQSAKKYSQDKLGDPESASPDGKQKVDRANIDATTVVVNADRVDGKGGTAAAPPTTAPPAGTTTAAAPAATTPPAAAAAAAGDGVTPKPDQPLAKPDGTATPAADTAAAAERASETPPPTPAADKPATDGQLPTIPSAKTDPAAAEAAAAADAAVARDLAYSPGDKPLEPVATTEDPKTKEDLQRKTAAAAVSAAAGTDAAQAVVPDKADIDKDALREADYSSTYLGLPEGKVRTKDGEQVKLDSETNRWDAMYTRDVGEDQKDKLSGRVAKLGDKHYEEYFDSTKKPQWREVTVGDIEGDQSVGVGDEKKVRTRDGLDALMDLDGIPGEMLGGSNLEDIQKHMIETGRLKPPAAVKDSGSVFDFGPGKIMAALAGTFGPNVEETLREGDAAREAARAAASIPSARTSGQTLGDQYRSANINPASSALQAPQQTAGTTTAAAAGGSSENTMTVTGRLTLEGLDAVLMEANGQRAVQTPNGGVPVVGDPPRSRVSGSRQK